MDTHFRMNGHFATGAEPTCYVRLKHCAGLLGMAPVADYAADLDLGVAPSASQAEAALRIGGRVSLLHASANRAELRMFNRPRLNA